MDVRKQIAARLKSARYGLGLTLEQAADLTGNKLKPSRIGNYEQATRRLFTAEAKLLAAAYGCSAAYLLCVDDDNGLTPRAKALVDHFSHADREGQDSILRHAEAEHISLSAKKSKR